MTESFPSESGSPGGSSARPVNRLAASRSPYLLQHAHNPVDWWPWCDEALESARRLNKPIFLSVGYSACHWCHVMEREVFENPSIAELMNRNFINIKVDREEHPDIDEIYMLATQLLTGSGGWPMNVWLTPDLVPFYAGTYFPPEDMPGQAGFPRVLFALAEAYQSRRREIDEQARRVAAGIIEQVRQTHLSPGRRDAAAWISAALRHDSNRFDGEWGGFRGAPKFPPHQTLLFWLLLLEHPDSDSWATDPGDATDQKNQTRQMLAVTLERMARGGIFDQLAGGFARYSTDTHWLVPHFEKMLYDNAQLAPIYIRAGQLFSNDFWTRTGRRTLDFWLESMMSEAGLFHSSLDADSEGREGGFYVWSPDEIDRVCDNDLDRTLLTLYFGFSPRGNYQGANVLSIVQDAEPIALRLNREPRAVVERIQVLSNRMLAMRNRRHAPAIDDKILAGWNGLMVSALAQAAAALGDPKYLQAAIKAIEALFFIHRDPHGVWLHVSRDATPAAIAAYLEDYAFVLQGVLDLAEALAAPVFGKSEAAHWWLIEARVLADDMIATFYDPIDGGFFATGASHSRLLVRLKPAADKAIPSSNAVAVRSLLRLARKYPEKKYRQLALETIESFAGMIERYPAMFPTMLAALVENRGRMDVPSETPASPPATDSANMLPHENIEFPVANPAKPVKLTGPPPDSAPTATFTRTIAARKEAGIFTINGPSRCRLRPGEEFSLALRLGIAPDYYIEAPATADGVRPVMRWSMETAAPVKISGVETPLPAPLTDIPHQPLGYRNLLSVTLRLTLLSPLAAGQYPAQIILRAAPCTLGCCLPEQSAAFFLMIEVVIEKILGKTTGQPI